MSTSRVRQVFSKLDDGEHDEETQETLNEFFERQQLRAKYRFDASVRRVQEDRERRAVEELSYESRK